jgi:hypothetical protein
MLSVLNCPPHGPKVPGSDPGSTARVDPSSQAGVDGGGSVEPEVDAPPEDPDAGASDPGRDEPAPVPVDPVPTRETDAPVDSGAAGAPGRGGAVKPVST